MLKNFLLKTIFVFIFLPFIFCSAPSYSMEKVKVIDAEDNYIAHDNGFVFDRSTNLEWIVFSYTQKITLTEASKWIDDLNINGGGWRLPSINDLLTLYNKKYPANITRLLKTKETGAVWSSKRSTAPPKDKAMAILFYLDAFQVWDKVWDRNYA